MVSLLERDEEIAVLREVLAAASAGRGGVVLVVGEAGIGKSSLLRAFQADPGRAARFLVGWCDDFLTNRAFGPLHDVGRRAGGTLADAVQSGDLNAVLDALMVELAYPLEPTVLVLEDLHWADDATLDVVRYVSRRIANLPAVAVLSFRSDELRPGHALAGVLGALADAPVRRVVPGQLSRRAVAALTEGTGLDPDEVVRITGGNPFFVTELAAGGSAVPASVGDAVLARLHRLPPASQQAVEALAVVPGAIAEDLVEVLVGDVAAIAEAERAGVVLAEGGALRFRHELARRAVLASLPASVQVQHHRKVLDHLLATASDAVRVLHHAAEAGRAELIAEHGPRALEQAYRSGAYREAVAHGQRVLARPDLLSQHTLGTVLEQQAWSLYNLQRLPEATEAMERSAALALQVGDRAARVRRLIGLVRMHYLMDGPGAALRTLGEAERMLAHAEDPDAEAEVGIWRLLVTGLRGAHEDVVAEAPPVADRARLLERVDLEVDADACAGLSMVALGDDRGIEVLEAAIARGREHGLQEPVARTYVALVEALLLQRRWEEARARIGEAVAFYDHHDYRARYDGVTPPCPGHRFDTLAQLARMAVQIGEWEQGAAVLHDLDRTIMETGLMGVAGLHAQALLAARAGADDAEVLLRRAWEVALTSDAAGYIVPVACAAIEWAWGTEQPAAAAGYVATAFSAAGESGWLAPLRWRLPLLGQPPDASGVVGEPERTSLLGDWESASEAWAAAGMPYEQALELLRSGDADATLDALRLFEELGAEPALRRTRQQLRALGVRSIPRGPRAATRSNPLGLTERQVEVLDLLAEGLTNAEIAERLVVSVRTVDHHVSTVLQKLGVSSRRQAAERAAVLAGEGD
jgi:DNA-binding CsgD family transcriptional regulator/tetratricopeptide (TPR) repeat protein